ncbi:MAG: OmpA family protein [Actinomycetota bacterium]
MTGRDPWPARRVLLLIALPAFCLVVAGAVLVSVPSMEDGLERRAADDLAAAGFDVSTLSVSFDGRDATVRGTVDSQSARVTIDDVIKHGGVRSVTVLVRNTEIDGPPERTVTAVDDTVLEQMMASEQALSLVLDEGTYVLRGRIRTESNRSTLVQRLAAAVAPAPVRFELQVDPTVEVTGDFGLLVDVVAATAEDATRLAVLIDGDTLLVELGTGVDPAAIEERLEELAAAVGVEALIDVQFEVPVLSTQDRLDPIVAQLVGEDVFVPGTADLAPGASDLLVQVAEVLSDTDDDVEIRIHVDGPASEDATALTEAQAEVIVSQLGVRGVSPTRVDAVGVGAAEPVGDAGDPANTRIEIEVQP